MSTEQPTLLRSRALLARMLPRNAVVAEVGVQRGRFARVIWRNARPEKLHLIDCWEHQSIEQYPIDGANASNDEQLENYRRMQRRLARGIRAGTIVIHKGYSVPTLAEFPDATFDWIYLDANHLEAAVAADLEAALPKMKSGGIIAGHDFIESRRRPHYGVVPAVREFCRRRNWELIYVTAEAGRDQGGRGNPSFAIRQAGLPPYQPPAPWWSPQSWLRRAA